MTMRQRGGATKNSRPRQSIRPTYEDFQPQFELKEEPEAHFIYVQLPDFLKEQVRITFVHAPGVIKVHGQRPLGNNRWSRFNQTFPLPQNCHESKIHGKFNNGVLTITLPKEVVAKVEEAAAKPIQETRPKPAAAAAAAEAKPQKVSEDNKVVPKEKDQILPPTSQKPAVQPKVQKDQDPIHQTAIASAAKDPQVAAPAPEGKAQKGLLLTEGIAETKEHKDKEAGVVAPNVVSAMTQNEKQRDEKRVIGLSSAASDPKPQKGKDETPPKTMAEEKAKKEVEARYISEANLKPGEPALSSSGERSKKATVIERFSTNTIDEVKKKSKRFGIGGVEQEKPEEDCVAAKQGMKNVHRWINNEDKQLLINVRAAIVVLVAFGAYTTYNLWCSGKPKN